MPLTDLTLHEAAQALRAGDTSSVALTEAYLARVDALNPALNAFLTVTADSARRAAQSADRRISEWRRDPSTPLHPLTGVPLAVKDVLCVKGTRTTAGSCSLENFIAPYTATAVQRLLDCGAVSLGKLNCDEFAMGSSNENSAYGIVRNPWDVSRVPGGSSGGSAAAVAARLALGALGTDTGGSIRQPAALCGVVGLKPSYGRVSRYGLIAFGSSLDCIGPFARTVADAALLFSATAGHDLLDATTMPNAVPDLTDLSIDMHGVRVGVPRDYFIDGMQAEVERAVREAIRVLESAGAQAVEISLPHTDYALPAYYLIAPAEASANLARFDGVRYGPREQAESLWEVYTHTRGARFGAEVKRRIMLGTYALSAGYYDAYYGQAQKVRTLIKRDFDEAFKQVDVIACPVSPTTAFKIGEKGDDPLAMYLADVFTLPGSLAGICGLSVPCGFDASNLPIGLQLLGPAFGEETILRVGHAYEWATEWHTRQPALA